MAARTIVCPDCGETVPPGHLTCPACGAMLASVSGGSVRPTGALGGPPGTGSEEDVDASVMTPALIESQVLPGTSPEAPGETPPAAPGPAVPLAPSSIRQTPIEGAGPMAAAGPASDGGYLPPGTPASPATPAPQATLPGPVPLGVAPPDAPPASVVTDPAPDEPSMAPGPDVARQDQALGYATAAGSALVAFGMFMPWSQAVIGASGVEGLFNTWGLASPGFVLVLLWALAVLAVSVVPNGIPVSIRSGMGGFILGVFTLGLVEPYVIGGLGAGIGVLVVAAGAIVLTAVGITSAWRDRHAADERSV